jgi:hypothetical protein
VSIIDDKAGASNPLGIRDRSGYKIEFVGLRPGEKLYEEPIHNGEDIEPTAHKKIHRLTNHLHGGSALESLEKIKAILYQTNARDLKQWLGQQIPEYKIWEG